MKTRQTVLPAVLLALILFGAASVRPQNVAAFGDPTDGVLVKFTAQVDRAWEWTIDKQVDPADASLTLAPGQTHFVDYEVVLSASPAAGDVVVRGHLGAVNSTGATIDLTGFEVNGVPAALSNCTRTVPGPLPNTYIVECDYVVALPGPVGQVTGVLTALGDSYPSNTITPTAAAEVDECVDVTDTLYGPLGTVCAGDSDKTFNYTIQVGPYDVCGDFTVENTASFTSNDTGATGSDSENVNIHVPCAGGCSLTPGYWKTHSAFGPAPYDDTWAQIGENTAFFLSGQSYYDVLWTSPSGNAYYILAHAYIAAQLNQLNGADFSAAQAAFDAATTLLNTYTPAQIGAMRGNNPVRAQFVALAGTLDDYNNGLIGPGHCTE